MVKKTLIPILSLMKLEDKIMGQTGKYKELKSIQCAVITVSDTRMEETDKNGKIIIGQLTEANHQVVMYEIIPDDRTLIQNTLKKQ